MYCLSTANSNEESIIIPVPWGELAGKCIGASTNNPVLCLHGWLDNCNTFEPLLPMLSPENFYVLIDLPGHGFSSHYPVGSYYTMYVYVEVVERIRRHFEWKTFDLLGHSLGGNISTWYSGTFPEYVQRLILIDTVGWFGHRKNGPSLLKTSVDQNQNFENAKVTVKEYTYKAALERIMEGHTGITQKSIEILLKRGLRKQSNGFYVFTRDFRHKLCYPVLINEAEAAFLLKQVRAETLHFIANDGLPNKKWSPKEMDVFLNCFKDCSFHEKISVDGNHHVHLDHPERICDHVTRFLKRPIRQSLLAKANI